MAKTASSRPAGGKATEAGMAFQAQVASWFAAHLLAQMPIGARFGLSAEATPVTIRHETGRYLDDIEVELTDGCWLLIQCKTSANLSDDADMPLGKTIGQLVDFWLNRSHDGPLFDPTKTVALLAVGTGASGPLSHLNSACRFFDHGARWGEEVGVLNAEQTRALEIFERHVRRAWQSLTDVSTPTNDDLAGLARMFRIQTFVFDGGADEALAARTLGAGLFGAETLGQAALPSLLAVVRRLVATGAPANRKGLLDALRRVGVVDTRNPPFEADFAKLKNLTRRELLRLRKHSSLPFGDGIAIPRECEADLAEAVRGGSLLIIGEPGAGKTGVLVTLADRLDAEGTTYLFLSVDRLAGAQGADGLQRELELQHRLTDVLAAWPGTAPAVLILDALDASRGGPSELVFSNLIEDLLAEVGERWSVVASIRTFDLVSGQRFRKMMVGAPPCPRFSEPQLRDVRHFLVPKLSPTELDGLGDRHPQFYAAIDAAPAAVRGLLVNVFNLSLAADLIQHNAFESLAAVRSQSDLIDRYEELRLDGPNAIPAIRAILEAMVKRRSLTIPRWEISAPGLADVMHKGVVVPAGDLIAFAHHVLFDHAAGRFFLERFDHAALLAQITQDPTIGFMLGPAFRFAVERMWHDAPDGRAAFWRFVVKATSTSGVDPILGSIALRSAAEKVRGPDDVAGLIEIFFSGILEPKRFGTMLSRLSRFARMANAGRSPLDPGVAIAWAQLAETAISRKNMAYADAARTLLLVLYDQAGLEDEAVLDAFGRAARTMLEIAWQQKPVNSVLSTIAIRSVGATYRSSPGASRDLLMRMFDPDHFFGLAHLEAPAIAEGVRHIIPADADFALTIYSLLFGRPAPQDGKSWLGGQASQILGLTTDKKQDYEHARYVLKRAYPQLLTVSIGHAARAASASVLGKASAFGELEASVASVNGKTVRVIADYGSLREWTSRHHQSSDDILPLFEDYLRTCPVERFVECVIACADNDVAASIWTRLFGIGRDRIDEVADILWPFACALPLLVLPGITRDAISFLRVAFPGRSRDERAHFELALVDAVRSEEDGNGRWTDIAGRFLYEADDGQFVSEEMRLLHTELSSSDQLGPNRPYAEFTIGSGEVTTELLLERSGVDLSAQDNVAVLAVSRPLEELVRSARDGLDEADISAIWRLASDAIDVIDRHAAAPDTVRAAWGAIGEGIERIVEADAYWADGRAQPDIAQLLGVVDRLAASPYPTPRESSDGSMLSWGNWDIRVYAASILVTLIPKLDRIEAAMLDRLWLMLRDPVPSVRLQVARSLNALYEVAREPMWSMMEHVAEHETHRHLLGTFVAGPLDILAYWDPDRSERLVTRVLERVAAHDDEDDRGDRSLFESLGGLAAHQWVGRSRPAARAWIDGWLADLRQNRGYLWSLISPLRQTLFLRYAPVDGDGEGEGLQDRARQLVTEIAALAETAMASARATLERIDADADEDERTQAQALFRAADSLLDHIGSQLYFGSGAYIERQSEDAPGLTDRTAKLRFLAEYDDLLGTLGRAGTPHTLHQLIELYEYLVDAAADRIFDRIAALLVGPAAREDYHFEHLAADGVVRLVRRYLADFRPVFDEPDRRARLLAVLELFSDAGWPEALNLLYELPDLLR